MGCAPPPRPLARPCLRGRMDQAKRTEQPQRAAPRYSNATFALRKRGAGGVRNGQTQVVPPVPPVEPPVPPVVPPVPPEVPPVPPVEPPVPPVEPPVPPVVPPVPPVEPPVPPVVPPVPPVVPPVPPVVPPVPPVAPPVPPVAPPVPPVPPVVPPAPPVAPPVPPVAPPAPAVPPVPALPPIPPELPALPPIPPELPALPPIPPVLPALPPLPAVPALPPLPAEEPPLPSGISLRSTSVSSVQLVTNNPAASRARKLGARSEPRRGELFKECLDIDEPRRAAASSPGNPKIARVCGRSESHGRFPRPAGAWICAPSYRSVTAVCRSRKLKAARHLARASRRQSIALKP